MTENINREEQANVITHGAGILLSVIGFVLLLITALQKGDQILLFGGVLYALCLVMMFTASTLYHASTNKSVRKKLQKWDHISIFFLIAGSYTPFLLYKIDENRSIMIFTIVIWTIALAGTLYRLFSKHISSLINALFYLAMGWMFVFLGRSFLVGFPKQVVTFIILGGLLYSLGVIFYLWKKLPYSHAIWHVFVLSAAVCHFVAVYKLVA